MSHYQSNAESHHQERVCPFCGEKTGNLPCHMRKCDGENHE